MSPAPRWSLMEDTSVFDARCLDDLRKNIELDATALSAEWSICIDFVRLGETVEFNADRMQDTMSLIKIAILISMMRLAERGEIDLDARCVLTEDDRRLGTSLISMLDAGLTLSLRDALTLMIVVSDNAATDICLRSIGGPRAVTRELKTLGLGGVEITGDALTWFTALVGSINTATEAYSPSEIFQKGYPRLDHVAYFERRKAYHFEGGQPFSLASSRGMVHLLRSIFRNEAASAENCNFMRKVLRAQQMQTMLPRYAFGITCEHKTANFFPFIASDAGIFTAPNGHVAIMAVMTQRYSGHRDHIENVIARIGQRVFTVLQSLPSN